MNPRIALNQITLLVEDFQANKEFFQRLGFKLIVDAPPRYARFQVSSGNPPSTFSIELSDNGAIKHHTAVIFFELESKQALDLHCDALKLAGVEFLEDPTDRDYLWREARIKTPEGHDVRFYFAGENRLHPPWRLE